MKQINNTNNYSKLLYINFLNYTKTNTNTEINHFHHNQIYLSTAFLQEQQRMLEIRHSEQKNSKKIFQSSQKDYISYLKSLLPSSFLQRQQTHKYIINNQQDKYLNSLDFFSPKPSSRQGYSLTKSRINPSQAKKDSSVLGQFLSKLVKAIAQHKNIDQYGQLQSITKELGIDIKQLNKIDNPDLKVQYMLNAIDNHIEDGKKKLFGGLKSQGSQSMTNFGTQKQNNFVLSTNNLTKKDNNFLSNSQLSEKIESKYQSFLKEQSKKDVDNFAWLEIKTKYPMLEKKLKAKLIQTINQDKNQKRIRDLIEKKQMSKKRINNNSTFSYYSDSKTNQSFQQKFSINKGSSRFYRRSNTPDIEDEKVDLINESLFMEQFDKAKIQYTWTESDEKMFIKNIQDARKKCSNNSQFLKLCGRFKFISQKEFQTLASQDISRALNKNNKIYLSRQFLLDKYYSTTETLTQQEMKFILKTSPMLSKCVDKNFIRNAIKNIRYENISDLQLKIAQDIIGRFEKLRNTVRDSRKMYKQQINQVAKQRIAYFEKNQQLQIAKQIAREELKNHKIHLMRALNYKTNHSQAKPKKSVGLSKKSTKNIWNPLNRYHPSTGLFVKDCNEQCTDDIYNPYEREYLKNIDDTKTVPKRNVLTKAEMIKFYTGGPDENILSTFEASQNDVKNICSVIKALFYEKKILACLQSVDPSSHEVIYLKRFDNKMSSNQLKTKKNLGMTVEQEMEMIAKKKLLENRQKAKQTVYVRKLLALSAENSYLALKALNPHFSPQQVNKKDKKGNTALFYACKYGNEEFVDFLMKFGSNPNVRCEKQFTPLHLAFKSNNMNIILQLLTSVLFPPNLNILNNQHKTPLAYCSRQILRKLNLEQGVTLADPNEPTMIFDNNRLLQKEEFDKIKEDALELQGQFAMRINQNKVNFKPNSTVTSIRNMSP